MSAKIVRAVVVTTTNTNTNSSDSVPSVPSAAAVAAIGKAALLVKIQSSKLTDLCDSQYARRTGFAPPVVRKRKIKTESTSSSSSNTASSSSNATTNNSNEYGFRAKAANTANDNYMNGSSRPDNNKGGSSSSSSKAKAAPQVYMVNGDIRVVESSLVLSNDTYNNSISRSNVTGGENPMEEMVEVSHSMATYASFLNRKGSSMWGLDETRLFYQCLRQCGLDFTVMQSFFPNRTRKQLKKKFFREEKTHYDLVMQALQSSLPLDLSPFDGIPVKDERTDEGVMPSSSVDDQFGSNVVEQADVKIFKSEDGGGKTLEI